MTISGEEKEVSRRNALGILATVSAALAFGCSGTEASESGEDGGASGAGSDAGANGDSGTSGDGGECAITPEGEIGPYFSDDSDSRFNRTNITANLDGTSVQEGIPLTLTVTVIDVGAGCVPYANAQVDIWHCNSSGVYSDQASESTTTEQWLRGYQLTDAKGQVTFNTVIPGWYQGRTTHIHLRVRSSYSNASSTSDGTNTTQLFSIKPSSTRSTRPSRPTAPKEKTTRRTQPTTFLRAKRKAQTFCRWLETTRVDTSRR